MSVSMCAGSAFTQLADYTDIWATEVCKILNWEKKSCQYENKFCFYVSEHVQETVFDFIKIVLLDF
jgi:hypothetical protein